MARARYIRPQFFLHEVLAELEAWIRLLFIGLWTLADRAGRLLDRPRRIHAALFPYEPALDVDDGLQQLHEAGFILRYEVDGERYIQVTGWAKHQTPHHQEVGSEIPAPVEVARTSESTPKPFGATSESTPKSFGATSESTPKSFGATSESTPKSFGATSESTPKPDRIDTESICLDPLPFTLDPLSLTEGANAKPTGLDEFLAAYPKRTKRDAAARAYVSVIESPEEHERLMAGLRRWLESSEWRRSLEKDGGRFVPNPDKFIFDRRYLDEPMPHTEGESGGDGDVVEQALRLMRRPDRGAA
jgi:hypothetical protein